PGGGQSFDHKSYQGCRQEAKERFALVRSETAGIQQKSEVRRMLPWTSLLFRPPRIVHLPPKGSTAPGISGLGTAGSACAWFTVWKTGVSRSVTELRSGATLTRAVRSLPTSGASLV